MRIQLFTFRYSATLGGFDDTPLLEFIRDKEVVAFREHFFLVNEVPHLTCVLTWQDAIVRPVVPPAGEALERPRLRSRSADRPDPTAGLDERERVLFNTLRTWRADKAREEGVPPFVVFTNRHLVQIVRRRPDSPTALGNVEGIGPSKVKRYAREVLDLLHPTCKTADVEVATAEPSVTSCTEDVT